MADYTLKQAAEAVGKSKPTLLRAIRSGKVSANRSEAGEWFIDPSELARAYPEMKQSGETRNATVTHNETVNETNVLQAVLEAEREKARLLAEQVADLRAERDRLLSVVEKSTESVRLLTDQRAMKQGLWDRIRGR